MFNLCCEKFQDKCVCEVIGMMFNFEWLNEFLFFGFYECVNGFWGNFDMEVFGMLFDVEMVLLKLLVDEGLLDVLILMDEVILLFVFGVC